VEAKAIAMIIKLASYGVGWKKTNIVADQYAVGKKAATENIPALGNSPVGQFLNGKQDDH